MAKLTSSTYKEQATLTSSIAFVPSVIATGFFLLALVMLYFETLPLSTTLEERLPFEMVRDEDSARLILNTLAAGIISLTVFSFSMVMIVLSQASSNLSPRVIPGLTTARSHQVVLGFYIGTIIYILLLLLSYKTEGDDDSRSPAIAILLGLAFGIVCLALFVYFIHSISRAIQVDNIMNSLFRQAMEALDLERDVMGKAHLPAAAPLDDYSYTLRNNSNGYLKQVDLTELQHLAQQHQLQLKVLVEVGTFVVEGTPMMQLTKDPASSKELCEALQKCFLISRDELVMKDFEEGVKQLSEIAVKALSPGINDPGTALKSIDYLCILFIQRMAFDERNCLLDEDRQLRVIDKTINLDELMHRYLSPIRTYGKADLQIGIRILRCLHNMLYQQPANDKARVIGKHAYAMVSDIDHSITNKVDRERLNDVIAELNRLLPENQALELLKV
ncbi:DUF2254 domain-containing protein [Pontibacter akesuensis]|uniref:Uncharacterized membrane protein n=1 Tax=Pontibacter akesuensis TaxID=388950 RepID=A0A1I7GMH2_9BACT|nr:DUF2254 domain-containing protein [Pontibacter akesuensis]GHA56014.1 hypothetical protein GCM10007389_04440 [Pontibacter akesuensis]SFU49624.1 Uncharacterized membrane protein [Pontibacter akesuensis]